MALGARAGLKEIKWNGMSICLCIALRCVAGEFSGFFFFFSFHFDTTAAPGMMERACCIYLLDVGSLLILAL
jgi:hypothetical protein